MTARTERRGATRTQQTRQLDERRAHPSQAAVERPAPAAAASPEPEPPIDDFARRVLLAMGLVLFAVAVVSYLRDVYIAGFLTCLAILAVTLAGLLPYLKEVVLPFGIRMRFWRREDR